MDIDTDDPVIKAATVMLTREPRKRGGSKTLATAAELQRDTHKAYDRLRDQIHGSISIGLKSKQSVVGGPPEKFDQRVANALRETKRDMRRLETMTEDQADELVDAIEAEITESFLSMK